MNVKQLNSNKMKTAKFLYLLLTISIAAISCTKSEDGPQPKEKEIVYDTFTISAPSTKTALSDGDKVSWKKDDQIIYYSNTGDATAGYEKRYADIQDDCSSAQVTLKRNSGEKFYVLCYAGITSSDMGLTSRELATFTPKNVLPATQTGAFSRANVCVGYIDLTKQPAVTTLSLQNVTSLVEFSTTADQNIKKVEFFGFDDEAVSADDANGRIVVDLTSPEHFVATPRGSETSKVITISDDNPLAGKSYFSVFPGTFSKGFGIKWDKLKSGKQYTYCCVGTNNSTSFTPGKIIDIGSPFNSTTSKYGVIDMTTAEIMTALDVPSGGFIQTLNLDDVTISAPTKSGSTSQQGNYNTQWRLYQARGTELTVSTSVGTIKNVKFDYTISNTGCLKDGSTVISSGTTVEVKSASKTFTIGNTGTATNGQVRITNIKVVLE